MVLDSYPIWGTQEAVVKIVTKFFLIQNGHHSFYFKNSKSGSYAWEKANLSCFLTQNECSHLRSSTDEFHILIFFKAE